MRTGASFSWLVVLLAALIPLAHGVQAEPAAPLRPLRFAPHWTPQAQFAGYYMALERGFYRDRGLEVTILNVGTNRSSSRLLADGAADVASLWLTTAIQQRDRGVPLVNVAQLLERSSLMLVAKKSSGIREPRDLDGRKVGVWEGDLLPQPLEFFRRHGVHPDLVPLGSTVNLFLRDGVDATVALWSDDYHTILNSGVDPGELTTFFFQDHDLNLPEEGLYCREDDLDRDASPCRDFVAASLAGWQEAFAHPEEAVALVMEQMLLAHVGTNAAHQRWMLDRVRDLMQPSRPSATAGVLRREDYRRAGEALRDGGSIAAIPDFERFHRPLVSPP
jgi:NitT/TauT family transport system substrate-binding protein